MQAGEFIFAVLSDRLEERVYPDLLPEGAIFPAIVHQLMSSGPINTMNSGVVAAERRYQIDVYALSRKEARQVAKDCVSLLTNDERLVCIYQDDRDMYEPDVRRYRTSLDFSIWESNDE